MMRRPGLVLAIVGIAAIAGFASAAPGRASVPPLTATAARLPAGDGDDSTGKVLFIENCQKCHGARGVPVKVMKQKFPRLPTMDAAFFAARSDDSIVTVLTNGKSEIMVSWKARFSVDEMKAIAAYIRTFAK